MKGILALLLVSLGLLGTAQAATCPTNSAAQFKIDGGLACAIQPSLIDPATKDKGSSNNGYGYHVVAIPDDPNQIKGTFLYMLGTNGRPYDQTNKVFQGTLVMSDAVKNGYMVLVVAYPNDAPTVGNQCAATIIAVPGCLTTARQELLYGNDVNSVVNINVPNSIMYRFTSLIGFLKTNLPSNFPYASAIAGPTVNWGSLRVGGHSEGGNNAAFISRDFRLEAACFLSSPVDYVTTNGVIGPAGWLTQAFATPSSIMRGVDHQDDSFYPYISVNYAALKLISSTSESLPNNDWLKLTAASNQSAHNSIIADPQFSYARVWACFSTNVVPPKAVQATQWQMVGAADFNQDGQNDLIWRNYTTGENQVWLMQGATKISTVSLLTVANIDWQLVASKDFTQDGKPDLLWRNYNTGENAIWQMNGTNYVTAISLPVSIDPNWQMTGAGDMNGDGQNDLLWRNYKTGENAVWQMYGPSLIGGVLINTVTDLNWQMVGAADMNGDGKADLLWRNTQTGDNSVWLMNGLNLTSGVLITSVSDLTWQMVSGADMTGDGIADLLWRNTNGTNALWQMNGLSFAQYFPIDTMPAN